MEEILANDEDFTIDEKTEELKKLLLTVEHWKLSPELNSINAKVTEKLNTLSSNQKQAYKNKINKMRNNETVSTQNFLDELKRILREISV